MRIGTRQGERGSSLVEMVVVVPLLLLVMAGVVDLGRAYFVSIKVIDAARAGARYGVTNPVGAEMCASAMAEAENLPLSVTLSCSANPGTGSGTPAKVTVSCNFPMIMGGWVGTSSIPISHTAAFRVR